MSDNMKKLCEIMRKYNVKAFAVSNELCLEYSCGGEVICYVGETNDDRWCITEDCEKIFNDPSIEPGDEISILFVVWPESNTPYGNVYRLGIDY